MSPDGRGCGRELGANSRDEGLRASRAAWTRPSPWGRRTRLHLVMQEAINVTNNLRNLPRHAPGRRPASDVLDRMYGCIGVMY